MILVSGATGFLGAHLVCMLVQQQQQPVRALKRRDSSLAGFEYIASVYQLTTTQRQQIHWFEADILDVVALEDAFEQITDVYHCAAMVSFLQKDKDRMMQVNIEGTANMVNQALRSGVRIFCHVSSIAAVGRTTSTALIDEQTQWVNSSRNSNYAISKYKAELEVWRAQEEGLRVVVVNPGVIIGVGDWRSGSCKLFETVWKGLPFYTMGVNGYVDVRDVTRVMFELVQKNITDERFILVGHNMQNQYFMFTVADLLGKKRASIRVTPLLAECAWWFFALRHWVTGKSPLVTKETARASLHSYHYSSEKIKKQLLFDFTPVEQTLSYICQYFLKDHTTS